MIMTWATPGTPSSRGRTTQSASERKSIAEVVVLVIEMSMISPIVEADRTEHRRPNAAGKTHLRQLLGDKLARAIDVGAEIEFHKHDGNSRCRIRSDAKHAGCPVHRRFDRQAHQRLDFLRRHAVRFGENRHRRRRQVGKDIDWCAHRKNSAVNQQRRREDQNDEAVLDGPLNDLVQHDDPLDLVRVRAGIGGPQFLKFELIRALGDNAFSGFDAGEDGDRSAVLVTEHDVAPFELFAGQADT